MRISALSALALCLVACGGVGLQTVNLLARLGSYERSGDVAYGTEAAQRLDVYAPAGAKDAPVVVFFHGGTWTNGRKEDYRFVGDALSSRGLVTLVVGYRQFPAVRFPEFLDDAARAVVWARENATRYGGDPDSLFVMGHSSGAHMAALVALDSRYLEHVEGDSRWVRGVIGLAGPYDFNARRADMREIFEGVSDAELSITQPITFAKSARMPLLLLHGESDQTVMKKNTVELTAAARREGGRACAIYYPEIDHAGVVAALSRPLRGRAPVLDDIARFVESVLAGAPAGPGCS